MHYASIIDHNSIARGMVRLYIIRHGDPDYETNKEQGGSLTENGRAEATALASYLKNEGITHAYSSPMGRAKLTAALALQEIPKFSTNFLHDKQLKSITDYTTSASSSSSSSSGGTNNDINNNFDENVGIEMWAKELSTWRQSGHLDEFPTRQSRKKAPAIWDFPAPIIRHQLCDLNRGQPNMKISGWKESCPDYSKIKSHFSEFCKDADEFLSRHGVLKEDGGSHDPNPPSPNYHLASHVADDPQLRHQKIALFCHGGTGLTLLSHLLSIPLPLVHGGMWLAPSSVTTIFSDEYQSNQKEEIIVTPRAIQIGGTNHLTAAGLTISNSEFEDNFERPSGIKHNFM